ncbi:MAG: hypothetical protein J6S98_08735 [Lentisphaeria bacterium]|nr:hypothetical protein [Lentisphaeria bacterium]
MKLRHSFTGVHFSGGRGGKSRRAAGKAQSRRRGSATLPAPVPRSVPVLMAV